LIIVRHLGLFLWAEKQLLYFALIILTFHFQLPAVTAVTAVTAEVPVTI
jgi:hypothetical protein